MYWFILYYQLFYELVDMDQQFISKLFCILTEVSMYRYG